MSNLEKIAQQLDISRENGKKVDFLGYLKAREDDIGNIRAATDFMERLHDEFFGDTSRHGATLPWPKTHGSFLVNPGEVTIWAGFNGHMKSMVTSHVMLDLISQGQKGLIASFEMKPERTLKRMACQAIGVKNPTELYVDKFGEMLQDKLWIYDQMGEVSPDRILGVVYYAAEKFGVQQIILDSLMKIVTDESGNDAHNAQKKFVNQLCAAAQELNIHVHLVHHSRKRDDERQRPTKQDAKGSGAIVDQCDNFISVFKIPRKDGVEDEGPTHCLYVDKARHQEWEGTIALWLHDGSLQFMEAERARAKEYVR